VASLSLENLSLTYPNGARAVDSIDLDIADGEFIAVLGPSGCGKSSLLRLVAGLESPTAGTIHMDGSDITHFEPKDRDVAMVFQGLALYPHMSVCENLAFGLAARKTPATETDRRVREAAETLGLARYLAKRPRELSGGERQRVALGRALVRRPRVYLFDEPLSSLDAQLRQELREELARLHRITKTTSIYVTHDQKEALSLGDRIVVLDRGRIRQVGTPETIYRDPCDLFVARFVGDPAINLIEGELRPEAAGVRFEGGGVGLSLPGQKERAGRAVLGLRPEAAILVDAAAEATRPESNLAMARAVLERVEHLGGDTLLHVRADSAAYVIRAPQGAALPAPGATVGLSIDKARALFFEPEGPRIRLG